MFWKLGFMGYSNMALDFRLDMKHTLKHAQKNFKNQSGSSKSSSTIIYKVTFGNMTSRANNMLHKIQDSIKITPKECDIRFWDTYETRPNP